MAGYSLYFGGVPIVFSYYNQTLSGSGVLHGQHIPYRDILAQCGDTQAEQATFIQTHAVKRIITGAGDELYNVLCRPDDTSTAQPTNIVAKCTGFTPAQGGSLYDTYIYYYAENPDLNIGIVQVGADVLNAGDKPNIYVFAVAIYGDDVGEDLLGVEFCTWWVAPEDHTCGEWGLSGGYPCTVSIAALNALGYDASTDLNSDDFGPGSDPDGYGQNGTPAFDHTSTTIGIPDPPSVSTSTVGFMNVHIVGAGALSTLGQYLFPSLGTITDVESALRNLVGIFYGRDSIQYIVDLHAIPVTPSSAGSKYIKLGSIETDISQPYTMSDYVDFNCGSISIPENFCNFVDYIGTTCKLFLPFVGFVTISPEYWNGGTLTVKYRFNVIDGSFMAYVLSTSSKSQLTNSLIGQYGGCACLHLPVLANSYGALASGLVAGSMSTVAGKSGAVAGAATGALSAYNFQGDMAQSNNYNCSTSFLGCRTPYLLIEREVPSFSTLYNKDKGLPLNVAVPLSRVHGFTVIEDIDLSGITGATDNELDELRRLLSEGVYF